MKETKGALPNAAKFFNANMRGGDYNFSSAIADLIDNSIQAKSTMIEILVDYSEKTVAIVDNGDGMDLATLDEAMKVASETHEYSEEDLGRYGTGMKAASLSQARRVKVASKARHGGSLNIQILDLDHITETNDWDQLVIVGEEDDLPAGVLAHFKSSSGTAVIWESLDRVFDDDRMSDQEAYAELTSQVEDARNHIGFVFHRFMTGEAAARPKISVSINGSSVEPIDPFWRSEPKTALVKDLELRYRNGTVSLQGYVLPTEKEFSSREAFKSAVAPGKRWMGSQGFYTYRNDRLISWGGWLGVRSLEEKVKLARIAFNFPSSLDAVMSVNVSRTKVQLSSQLKAAIYDAVREVVSQAELRYRKKHTAENTLSDLRGVLENPVGSRRSPMRKTSAHDLAQELERTARKIGLSDELAKIKTSFSKAQPEIAKEVGWIHDDE